MLFCCFGLDVHSILTVYLTVLEKSCCLTNRTPEEALDFPRVLVFRITMSSFLPGNSSAQKNLLKFVKHSDRNQNNSNDEKNWHEKTVKTIIKKIKNNPGALSSLEKAITREDSSTDCVTFPR